MKFETKTFKEETVREVLKIMEEKHGRGNAYKTYTPIINGGYPTFNICDHTTIDMTTVENKGLHTLSIKVGEDTYVTLCVMPMMDGDYINVDVQMVSTNENRQQKAIHFGKLNEGIKDTSIEKLNLLALISELKK